MQFGEGDGVITVVAVCHCRCSNSGAWKAIGARGELASPVEATTVFCIIFNLADDTSV